MCMRVFDLILNAQTIKSLSVISQRRPGKGKRKASRNEMTVPRVSQDLIGLFVDKELFIIN